MVVALAAAFGGFSQSSIQSVGVHGMTPERIIGNATNACELYNCTSTYSIPYQSHNKTKYSGHFNPPSVITKPSELEDKECKNGKQKYDQCIKEKNECLAIVNAQSHKTDISEIELDGFEDGAIKSTDCSNIQRACDDDKSALESRIIRLNAINRNHTETINQLKSKLNDTLTQLEKEKKSKNTHSNNPQQTHQIETFNQKPERIVTFELGLNGYLDLSIKDQFGQQIAENESPIPNLSQMTDKTFRSLGSINRIEIKNAHLYAEDCKRLFDLVRYNKDFFEEICIKNSYVYGCDVNHFYQIPRNIKISASNTCFDDESTFALEKTFGVGYIIKGRKNQIMNQ